MAEIAALDAIKEVLSEPGPKKAVVIGRKKRTQFSILAGARQLVFEERNKIKPACIEGLNKYCRDFGKKDSPVVVMDDDTEQTLGILLAANERITITRELLFRVTLLHAGLEIPCSANSIDEALTKALLVVPF